LLTYEQRTTLRFPLQSPSIVTQGPFNNSGHASYTNQFAIDVMGLGAAYGPMGGSGTGNKEFAGFGAVVIAPASGRVVYARNDVPDNEPGQDSEAVYGAQREPLMATAGNAVIIDHGNGEYSTLMHLQRGSVTVAAGDSVRAGQPIARIGNSGDSFQPHLHFQLQNGPELFRATTLPVTFTNLDARSLARGEYLSPR
jgi:murein DD-endopeptidase MepM/ murein hydrolase activator NlpD